MSTTQRARRTLGSFLLCAAALAAALAERPAAQAPSAFTLDDILSYPFPDSLIAASAGSAVAWTFNERGQRNIYVASAPDFAARRVTAVPARRRAGADEPVVFERRQDAGLRARGRAQLELARRRQPAAESGGRHDAAQGAGVVGACGRRHAGAARRRRRARRRAANQPGGVRARSPHLDRAASTDRSRPSRRSSRAARARRPPGRPMARRSRSSRTATTTASSGSSRRDSPSATWRRPPRATPRPRGHATARRSRGCGSLAAAARRSLRCCSSRRPGRSGWHRWIQRRPDAGAKRARPGRAARRS